VGRAQEQQPGGVPIAVILIEPPPPAALHRLLQEPLIATARAFNILTAPNSNYTAKTSSCSSVRHVKLKATLRAPQNPPTPNPERHTHHHKTRNT
jgi:hypothetical protein